jgi:antigen KI-67
MDDAAELLAQTAFAYIVVIKRNGQDGPRFPLVDDQCYVGRAPDCDIRLQIPAVSKRHCRLAVNENLEIVLENLSDHGQTVLNNEAIAAPTVVPQGGVFTVVDRSFRVEYVDLKGHGFTFTHKDRHAADYDSSDVTTEVTRDTLQRVRAMSTSSPANGATAAANQFAPKLSTITEAQSPKNVKPVTPKAVTPKPATPKAAPTPKVATPKASTPAKAAASPAVRAGMPIDLLKGIQAKRRSLQLLCSPDHKDNLAVVEVSDAVEPVKAVSASKTGSGKKRKADEDADHSEDHSIKNVLQYVDVQWVPETAKSPKKLPTPKVATDGIAVTPVKAVLLALSPASHKSKSALPTPVRQQIKALRGAKHDDAEESQVVASMAAQVTPQRNTPAKSAAKSPVLSKSPAVVTKPTLPTPVRNQIQARRQSAAAVLTPSQMSTTPTPKSKSPVAAAVVSAGVLASPKSPKAKSPKKADIDDEDDEAQVASAFAIMRAVAQQEESEHMAAAQPVKPSTPTLMRNSIRSRNVRFGENTTRTIPSRAELLTVLSPPVVSPKAASPKASSPKSPKSAVALEAVAAMINTLPQRRR